MKICTSAMYSTARENVVVLLHEGNKCVMVLRLHKSIHGVLFNLIEIEGFLQRSDIQGRLLAISERALLINHA
jgi:hypothetical protein